MFKLTGSVKVEDEFIEEAIETHGTNFALIASLLNNQECVML